MGVSQGHWGYTVVVQVYVCLIQREKNQLLCQCELELRRLRMLQRTNHLPETFENLSLSESTVIQENIQSYDVTMVYLSEEAHISLWIFRKRFGHFFYVKKSSFRDFCAWNVFRGWCNVLWERWSTPPPPNHPPKKKHKRCWGKNQILQVHGTKSPSASQLSSIQPLLLHMPTVLSPVVDGRWGFNHVQYSNLTLSWLFILKPWPNTSFASMHQSEFADNT